MSKKDAQYVDVIDEPLAGRREIEEIEMDITPMIDITFLLLIFFLVASRLSEDAPVELPPARHGTAVTMKSSAIITLAQSGGDTAEIYRGDGKNDQTRVPESSPEDQEQLIVEYIEKQRDLGKSNVLIKAESGVKHGEVSRVAKAVRAVGNETMFVAVLEVQ